MLESRSCYGYAKSSGVRTSKELEMYEVCYRCYDGGFGILGYLGLFADKAKAQAKADEFKASHSYCSEAWVRHPSKIYSRY